VSLANSIPDSCRFAARLSVTTHHRASGAAMITTDTISPTHSDFLSSSSPRRASACLLRRLPSSFQKPAEICRRPYSPLLPRHGRRHSHLKRKGGRDRADEERLVFGSGSTSRLGAGQGRKECGSGDGPRGKNDTSISRLGKLVLNAAA
jgi:hypothetical protein